jgi:hypothetical protein
MNAASDTDRLRPTLEAAGLQPSRTMQHLLASPNDPDLNAWRDPRTGKWFVSPKMMDYLSRTPDLCGSAGTAENTV